MHAAIKDVTTNHPDCFDPVVIFCGFTSHFCYAVPLALIVKHRLTSEATG